MGMDGREKNVTDETGGITGNCGILSSFSSSLISITTPLLMVTIITNQWAALLAKLGNKKIFTNKANFDVHEQARAPLGTSSGVSEHGVSLQ